LKHRIPFHYRRDIVRTYTYTEMKYRTRVSRTLSFVLTDWYTNGSLDVTLDINKLFSTTVHSKYSSLNIPFHIGYAIQILEHIGIPLDVVLLCIKYER
jgi:hypothetical protein